MTDGHGRPYPLPDDIDTVDNAPIRHVCVNTNDVPASFFGGAVTHVVFNDGLWWATAGNEYATAIGFCPFCGEKLAMPQ